MCYIRESINNKGKNTTKLLTTLGLNHVADTIVGDENIRGISGGQKRRVTVGEMLCPHCSFICMENITDGLSSTDSVKLITDLANVSSLYTLCIYTFCLLLLTYSCHSSTSLVG